ncbi:MAG TPA: hypothetical protein VGN14_05455 [Candidatus Elarobacter sp.]|jgi:hypothetical protein
MPADRPDPQSYIIQIVEREAPTIDSVRRSLRDTGVILDAEYGPYPVDPHRGLYVAHCWADEPSRRRAEDRGIAFFDDPEITPTARQA